MEKLVAYSIMIILAIQPSQSQSTYGSGNAPNAGEFASVAAVVATFINNQCFFGGR